jgi:hypothetical protein
LLKRPRSFVITFLSAHFSTFYWERRWIEAARNWIELRRARWAADRRESALEVAE